MSTVTIRDRDSCRQWRVAAAGVSRAIGDLLEGQAIPAAGVEHGPDEGS